MAFKWRSVRLGDYIDSSLGKMLDAKKNKGTPQPYLGNSNVRWGAFDLNDLAEMRFEEHEEERYGIRDGDLIICEGGEPGRCAIWRNQAATMKIQKALHRVRGKNGLNNEYLYYWLMFAGRAGLLESHFTGTTIKHLTGRALAGIDVPLPPTSDQNVIVSVLGALDARIDNLRQANATLEAIAQALFKSWFVDFDPVRAKAEGREPEGMDAATADLFPGEFEDSELGPIPKGWSIARFDQEFDFTMGQSPPGSTYNEIGSGTPFYQGCTDFGDVFPSERVFCTEPTRLARAGDLLMSVRAPVGALNIARNDCSIGRGLCAIRHRSGSTGLTQEIVKASLNRIESAAGEGALFKSLSKQQLASLPVLVSPVVLTQAMASLQDPLTARRILAAEQAVDLAKLRDTLLPRLISGRLRLPEAGREVEAAIA